MSAKIFLVSCAFFLCLLLDVYSQPGPFVRDPKELEFLVVTVATDETDGYKRFMRSCNDYNISVKVVGMGREWRGGDMLRNPGGGQKINLLKDAVKQYKDKNNLIMMFSDSYDAVFLANPDTFIRSFLEFNANAVFSAEGFCWPDRWLVDKYPHVKHGKRYLCSGGIMAYAPVFYKILTDSPVKDKDDDQLYYTNIYLDEKKREKLNITLDHTAKIMQNLNGAQDEVVLEMDGADVFVKNVEYETKPLWIHGNGPSKLYLNYLTNYVPGVWNKEHGCTGCSEDVINLEGKKDEELPRVMLAIMIPVPTPFMPEFFTKIQNIDYPKSRIDLYVHNMVEFHKKDVENWLTDDLRKEYNSVQVHGFAYTYEHAQDKEFAARNQIVEECIKAGSDYLFAVNSEVSFTNPGVLKVLMSQNKPVIVPMLTKYKKLWSNFWGAIGEDGYYARSEDYIDIVQYKRMGVWNSPFTASVHLIKKEVLPNIRHSYGHKFLDPDMAFSNFLRDKGIFMYVMNTHYFGHLKELETFTTNHLHNDLWQIFDNPVDWREKYIHENYSQNLNESIPIAMPCPDVFWFPLTSETWARHMIEEMEHYGKWSGGGHEDKRLAGGYENVPTVDIHMNQVGYEREWLHFLKQYVVPVNGRLFPGYYSEGRAIMNFMVKYTPSGQYYLRPHHDSSTYTINIGLNKPGVEYGGGGSRFIRQDCAVQDTRVGWSIMHPGRLTHFHEGLPTTWGTRYIMVCFVDP